MPQIMRNLGDSFDLNQNHHGAGTWDPHKRPIFKIHKIRILSGRYDFERSYMYGETFIIASDSKSTTADIIDPTVRYETKDPE